MALNATPPGQGAGGQGAGQSNTIYGRILSARNEVLSAHNSAKDKSREASNNNDFDLSLKYDILANQLLKRYQDLSDFLSAWLNVNVFSAEDKDNLLEIIKGLVTDVRNNNEVATTITEISSAFEFLKGAGEFAKDAIETLQNE